MQSFDCSCSDGLSSGEAGRAQFSRAGPRMVCLNQVLSRLGSDKTRFGQNAKKLDIPQEAPSRCRVGGWGVSELSQREITVLITKATLTRTVFRLSWTECRHCKVRGRGFTRYGRSTGTTRLNSLQARRCRTTTSRDQPFSKDAKSVSAQSCPKPMCLGLRDILRRNGYAVPGYERLFQI